eukprot:1880505-Prymnesium_polylepis.2
MAFWGNFSCIHPYFHAAFPRSAKPAGLLALYGAFRCSSEPPFRLPDPRLRCAHAASPSTSPRRARQRAPLARHPPAGRAEG